MQVGSIMPSSIKQPDSDCCWRAAPNGEVLWALSPYRFRLI